MSTTAPRSTPPTYYEILGLSLSIIDQQDNPSQFIKRAYRRALLSHHPDKKPASKPTTNTSTFTIDQISTAYAVLSNPSSRTSYDKLLLTATTTANNPAASQFQTGIETIDLDDLAHDGEQTQWYRPCRCGNERGYRFNEEDLEDASDLGELMVGCVDCSLWLRVQFAVVDDEDDEGGIELAS